MGLLGGILALRAPCTLLLYCIPQKSPQTKTIKTRLPQKLGSAKLLPYLETTCKTEDST